jgi:hypothetical protein
MITVVSPRPPLNLFNVARLNVQSFYTTLLDVPEYLIPVNGPSPARTVSTVALLTSLVVSNNSEDTIQVSVQVVDSGGINWLTLNQMDIPANDFAVIDFGKQNLPSGDKFQIRTNNFQGAVATLSYVLNQREEYRIL